MPFRRSSITTSMGTSPMGFQDSILALLAKVECRRAVLDSEKEEIYKLRYAAYKREGTLPPGAPALFKDKFDDVENGATFALYFEGRLASSIRVHVATSKCPVIPAMSTFSDHLQPLIEQGYVVLDPTRFVIESQLAQSLPKLPYATLRICWMASDHCRADYVLATVRSEHQSFYRRLFGHHLVCAPRPYPSLSKPITLMLLDFRKERARIIDRYPFFSCGKSELARTFGDWMPSSVENRTADRTTTELSSV